MVSPGLSAAAASRDLRKKKWSSAQTMPVPADSSSSTRLKSRDSAVISRTITAMSAYGNSA
jgi:hypothetical protein